MRKLFKGGKYSREETINYLEVLTAETIQRRKVFKGGNYMRNTVVIFTTELVILGTFMKWGKVVSCMEEFQKYVF